MLGMLFRVQAIAQCWTLVWSDEFESSTIDQAKWNFDIGTGVPLTGWGNNELQYYTDRPENVRVEDGMLVIEAREESYSGSIYTSARLNTKFKGDWTYGRFEFRARLPKGRGIWPALWMLPTDQEYGMWAASGEIDIMEFRGNQPATVYGTLHYGGEWPNNVYSGSFFTLQEGSFSDDFHVFVLEWEPDSIRWLVADDLYQVQHRGKPFDKRFHLLMNVAVGGIWPGTPDSSTVFPQQMWVDYVRVYISTSSGDFDGDTKTDFDDFLLFSDKFGATEDDDEYEAVYDLNCDGKINFGDFFIFADDFGRIF